MKKIRIFLLQLKKLMPKNGALKNCKTDVAKQKFADSQLNLSNALFAGTLLATMALLAKIDHASRIDGFFLVWSFVSISLFVMASVLRQRALRLTDAIELKRLRHCR
ncbi:MAG: hypothetical protein Q4G62_04065 [Pseudomonadota bacterium]|nr:hypothetical protein [Pseudomonadota bacterium]